MKVFVGNLSDETNEGDLRQAFESFGLVRSITIVRDGVTHKSRGFGFVIMPSMNEAKNAIEKIDGKDLRGQKINVKKARTKRKPHGGRRGRSDFNIGGRAGKGRRRSSGGRRGRGRH
jgi:RNA recognition motif-containing protein